MNQLKSILFSFLFIISIFSAFKIFKSEQLQQQHKDELVTLSSIEYGLLNVDTWENLLADIIATQLQDFNDDNDGADNEDMKKNVGALLKTLIDDYEKTTQKKNSGGLFGSVKNSLYASAFDGIREDIPMLTDKVMSYLDVKNNTDGIKQYIITLLKKYTEGTFERTDYTAVNLSLIHI